MSISYITASNKKYDSLATGRLTLWLIKSNVLAGANCLFAPTDITKPEDVEAALAQTKVILTCRRTVLICIPTS
jgi:hypothetical protein